MDQRIAAMVICPICNKPQGCVFEDFSGHACQICEHNKELNKGYSCVYRNGNARPAIPTESMICEKCEEMLYTRGLLAVLCTYASIDSSAVRFPTIRIVFKMK